MVAFILMMMVLNFSEICLEYDDDDDAMVILIMMMRTQIVFMMMMMTMMQVLPVKLVQTTSESCHL